jgi:methylated-DNA-protein-cysteine methyltransferase related protein
MRMIPMGFFEDVYAAVKKIPRGKVATYGQIARVVGQPEKARIVGWALHSNPYMGEVPCHRIVNRNGELSGNYAFGGYEAQKKLLEDEGIIFDKEGIIDLQTYLWKPR